jgi:hypothetical protein
MPAVLALGLTLTALVLGAFGVAPEASAEVKRSHSGAICTHYLPEDATVIGHPWGTTSYKEAQTYVICPLPRTTEYANGAYIDVFIEHTGSLYVEKTTTCTAVSRDFNGEELAAETHSWTGTGVSTLSFNLTGENHSNEWSTYSVLCAIPGYTSGRIHGLTLIEPPLP